VGEGARAVPTILIRNKEVGTLRLAHPTLKISSNFVGCSIGKSDGAAPLANLSTYSAARPFEAYQLRGDRASSHIFTDAGCVTIL
jgi:hypothetical protein